MDSPTTPQAVVRPMLYLVLWQQQGARNRAEQLASWGYDVRYDYQYNADELDDAVGRLLALKPAAVLLSLAELPGYTRSLALGLKAKSGLRDIPRLIVDGNAQQREQLALALPDAKLSSWDELREALSALLGGEPPAPELEPLPEVRAFH